MPLVRRTCVSFATTVPVEKLPVIFPTGALASDTAAGPIGDAMLLLGTFDPKGYLLTDFVLKLKGPLRASDEFQKRFALDLGEIGMLEC